MILAIAFLSAFVAQAHISHPVLKSPGGRLVLTFDTLEKGQLAYSIAYKDKSLIERSGMTLNLQGQQPLGAAVKIVGATPSQTDETYRLVTGKASVVRNRYNALKLDLEDVGPAARRFSVEARAYDDAIAFRYVVPDQPAMNELRLTSEATEFRLSKDATTYALLLPHFRTQYESEYVKLNASAFSGQNGLSKKLLIGLPFLMHLPGVAWAAITEADLRGNSSMYLVNTATNWGGRVFQIADCAGRRSGCGHHRHAAA